jgi:hypothetical protein
MQLHSLQDGAIINPAPLHQDEFARYARDSKRALRTRKLRKFPCLQSFALWSILAALTAPYVAVQFA